MKAWVIRAHHLLEAYRISPDLHNPCAIIKEKSLLMLVTL
jgi:hypothetical protein